MVAPRNMPDLSGYETPYLLLLVVGGQVGLPILVLTTFLSKRLHVHPALWNFWLTWVRYSTHLTRALSYICIRRSSIPSLIASCT
jgi:hypothetical protein